MWGGRRCSLPAVLVLAAIQTSQGYLTCSGGVHEWIRFHDFVDDNTEDFLELIELALTPTPADGTTDLPRIIALIGHLGTSTREHTYSNSDTMRWYLEASQSHLINFPDIGRAYATRLVTPINNHIGTSINASRGEGYMTAADETEYFRDTLGYKTNVQYCKDIVKRMSVGFHATRSTDFLAQHTNGMADDDGLMYGYPHSKVPGCKNSKNFELHDMFARAAAMLTCTRYTYWDDRGIIKDDQRSRSREYRIEGGGALFGLLPKSGHTCIVGAAKWLTGGNAGAPRDSSIQSCGKVARADEDFLFMRPNSRMDTLCWTFVADMYLMACNLKYFWDDGDSLNLIWALRELVKLIWKRHRGNVNAAVAAEGEWVRPYAEFARKINGNFPSYANMAESPATWPGWGKTQATCSKSQNDIASVDDPLEGVVKLLAKDSRDYVDESIVAEQIAESKAKAADLANVKIADVSGRQGQLPPPVVTGEDTGGLVMTTSTADQQRRVQAALDDEPLVLIRESGASDPDNVICRLAEGNIEKSYQVEAPAGGDDSSSSKSSESWSTMSSKSVQFVSYYVKYRAFMSSRYENDKLSNTIRWMEKELGEGGSVLATPLKWIASIGTSIEFALEQSLIKAALKYGLCEPPNPHQSRFTADRKCMCEVVEPILQALEETKDQRLRDAIGDRGDHSAITLLYSKFIGGHASAIGADGGAGLYVTFQWQPYLAFDIGGTIDATYSISLGTDVVTASAAAGFKMGVFFGLHSEIGAYRKGINFGGALGLKVAVGLEVLFKEKYLAHDQATSATVTECAPLFGGAGVVGGETLRMLLFPVHPKCINGFSVVISGEIGGEYTGVTFNVYSSHQVAGAAMSFLGYSQVKGLSIAGTHLSDVPTAPSGVAAAMGRALEQDVSTLESDLDCMIATAASGKADESCSRNAVPANQIGSPFTAEYWPSSSFNWLNGESFNTSQYKPAVHKPTYTQAHR